MKSVQRLAQKKRPLQAPTEYDTQSDPKLQLQSTEAI